MNKPDFDVKTARARYADIYTTDRIALSYELFPPKTEEGFERLMEQVSELAPFGPAYITCTYGAGGSTSKRTLEVIDSVRQQFSVPVAAHVTCVGATRDELHEYLAEADRREVSFVVALRGDPPAGEESFVPVDGGFCYANELVEYVRERFPQFGVAVAGYPETHIEAPNRQADLDNLKRKVDAGADVVITQLFYDNDDFYRFRDRCELMGIGVPIVPGILPVTNLGQIVRLTKRCGAALPPRLLSRLENQSDDAQGQFDVGVYHATRQVEDLVTRGVPGIHFYCLNRSRAVATILRALSLPDDTFRRPRQG